MLVVRAIDAGLVYRFERRHRPFPVPGVLRGFFLAVIYLVVLFIVLKGVLGINITPFLATSAIFTAIIGLALQGVLGNVLAGISLNLTKSFSRGDWVSIGTHEGVVVDTNWRETLIRDRASNIVVIPNNAAASEMIVNFSRPELKTALTIPLKVSFSAPAAEVLDILRQAAREVPDVLQTPAPLAYILSYDDVGVSYLAKFWVTDYALKDIIVTEVSRHIWYKFRRQPYRDTGRADRGGQAGRERDQDRSDGGNRGPGRRIELWRPLESQLFRAADGERAGELLVPAEDVRLLADLVETPRLHERRSRFPAGR